jgi:hypothetical protein
MTGGAKYTVAYSIDLDDLITADDAYSYRSQGLISAPDAFLCASADCKAKMMCVVIDKLPDVRKREPHFRTVGTTDTHDPIKCSYHNGLPEFEEEVEDGEKRFTNRPKNAGAEIVFLEIAPPRLQRHRSDASNLGTITKRSSSFGDGSGKPKSQNTTTYSRIRPLVRQFLKLSNEQRSTMYIKIGAASITYNELFFFFNSLKRVLSTHEEKIFYGMGYINQINEKLWQLRFHFHQILGETMERPSVFINQNDISAYNERSGIEKLIEKSMNGKDQKIDIYAYGTPALSKCERYIKINVKSLDHLYFFPFVYVDDD